MQVLFCTHLIWKMFFKTQRLRCRLSDASKCTFEPLIPLARQMSLWKLQINWRLLYITYKWSVSDWGSTRMWGSGLESLQQGTFKQTGSWLCQVWMQQHCQHLDVCWWYTAQTAQFKVLLILSWSGWGRWSGGLEKLSDELRSRWNIQYLCK